MDKRKQHELLQAIKDYSEQPAETEYNPDCNSNIFVGFSDDDSKSILSNFVREDSFSNNVCEYKPIQKISDLGKFFTSSQDLLAKTHPIIRQEAYATHLEELEEIKNTLKNDKGHSVSTEELAANAASAILKLHEDTTGYDASWVFDLYKDATRSACSGRAPTYSATERKTNCLFIKMLCDRGSSETQAKKLLLRLRGDKAMSSKKTISKHYDKYKSLELYKENTTEINYLYSNLEELSSFLLFTVTDDIFIDKEAAYKKAITAFKKLCSEIVDILDNTFGGKEHDLLEEWQKFKAAPIEKLYHNPVYNKAFPSVYGMVDEWFNCLANDLIPEE